MSRNNKKDDFYIDHYEMSKKPHRFLIATDRYVQLCSYHAQVNLQEY